jgi:hypothetical protein
MLPRTTISVLTLPFSRLFDRIGEDMQAWCDTRIQVASAKPRWIAEAAQFYWHQMSGVKDRRTREILEGWRDSIVHKMNIVRLIDLDASPAQLNDAFGQHPSTQNLRDCTDEYLIWLARRLEIDALAELNLLLARAYQLGYHNMLIYPFNPPVLRKTRNTVRVLRAPSMNR